MPVVIGGDDQGPQQLDSVLLEKGTGKCIANGVVLSLEKWGVKKDVPETAPLIQVVDTTHSGSEAVLGLI
jgi:hypothetical protein